MRRLVPLLLLLATLRLGAQVPRLTEVQERRLANGTRVLLVERRGLAAFHATLAFRGGRAEEPATLVGATDLLARALYGGTWPEDLDPAKSAPLDALLRQEEAALEALRVGRLQARRDPAAATRVVELEAGLAALQGRIRGLGPGAPLQDVYAALGGRQGAEATADGLRAWTELPLEAFETWCRTETQRLRILQLSHFSAARQELSAAFRAQAPEGWSLLLGAALPGHPYGRDRASHLPVLQAIRWSALRAHARQVLAPERMTLILVGGLSLEAALPLLERHFGTLPGQPALEEPVLPDIPADLGDRRAQASFGGSPRLLVGWRIPPRSHPDHLPLQVAAHLLAGGQAARLSSHLVQQKALALSIGLAFGLPGGRQSNLLALDLQPALGHGLPELEKALHGEVLRLQQDPISPEAWQRALAQLETDHLRTLDEPARLAGALAQAWIEGGDWRLADLEVQRLRSLRPEDVQAAARAWMNPAHRTTVWLEPDPEAGLDPLEAEAARVLKALAATRVEDPAQREHLVSEGLRQMRMLSPEERTRTLKLLEAQLPRVKP